MTMDIRKKIVIPALVGAIYTVLTVLFAPISYGFAQCRVSELLCVLPFFLPGTAWGLFLGCALANTVSLAGPLDIVFGSLATLLAGLCTARIGRAWRLGGGLPSLSARFLACLMPVLFNGVIVGAVLAYTLAEGAFWPSYAFIGIQVAGGEAAALYALGLPLLTYVARRPTVLTFMERQKSGEVL